MKKATLLLILLLILSLTACGTESEGKKVVEGYLNEVKDGEKTDDYITFDVDRFIDVFEYEFISAEEIEDEKNTLLYSRYSWEIYDAGYETFEKYKEYVKGRENSKGLEVLSDNDDLLELWKDGEYKTVYKYLYNVTIANEGGEKLYKKIDFEVSDGHFEEVEDDLVMKIRSINIR